MSFSTLILWLRFVPVRHGGFHTGFGRRMAPGTPRKEDTCVRHGPVPLSGAVRGIPPAFLLSLLLSLIFCSTPGAQESGAGKENPAPLLTLRLADGRTFEVFADSMDVFVQDEMRVVILHGGVHAVLGDEHLWAENLVLWFDYTESLRLYRALEKKPFDYGYLVPRPESSPVLEPFFSPWTGDPMELYAEGPVKMSNGDVVLFCDRLYSNFAEKRGVLLHGEIFGKAEVNGRSHPLHVQAEAIRRVYEKLFTMEKTSFSTCVFGVPHYEVKVEKALLRGTPANGTLLLDDPSVARRGLALPLPDIHFETGRHWDFPLRSVSGGSSSRFGAHLLVLLGKDFDRFGQSVQSNLGLDAPFKGDWGLNVDLYGKRGVGLGGTLDYESPGLYKGYITGYHIHDQANADRGGKPIENPERYRIRTQNRIQVGKDRLLDLELSKISDRNFLDEYFENEYKTQKEQETYLYLHETGASHAWSVLSRWRLNGFDSQNEYLPQAIWDVSAVPITGGGGGTKYLGFLETSGIFYGHRTELSNVRNRPDDATSTPSDRVFRGDYWSSFTAPVRVHPFKITPFYENRVSFFDHTVDDSGATGRVVESFGVRMGFLTHTRSDYTNDFLNIDRLRNILEPGIEYRKNFAVSHEPDDLFQFDGVEAPARGDTFTLYLRHRLQTHQEGKVLPHDLIDGIYALPLYPDERLSETGHTLGNFRFETWIRPLFRPGWLHGFYIDEQGEYDPNDRRMVKLNSDLVIRPNPDWVFRGWHRWNREDYSFVGVTARRLLTEKWEIEMELRYNIELNKWADQVLTFRRRAHQWLFELHFSVDKGDNNTSVTLAVTPLAIFGPSQKGSIYDPMLGE